MILKPLADFHGWLADKDFIWWPFSFLRPKSHELMNYKLTLQMTLYFGGLSYIMLLIFSWMNNMVSFEGEIQKFLGCFLGFGVWFNLITKPLWNYRAKKLKRS